MVRKAVVLGMLVMFFAATAAVSAEEVFLTAKGTKYHKETCRLIKNKDSVTTLEKQEAIDEGYEPCKRCFREDVTEELSKAEPEQIETQTKKESKKK